MLWFIQRACAKVQPAFFLPVFFAITQLASCTLLYGNDRGRATALQQLLARVQHTAASIQFLERAIATSK
jgi:hypothetical protein